MNTAKVAFWRKDSGNYMSASKGLTEDQVAALHDVRVGDRFILFYNSPNEKYGDSSPDLSLQIYQKQREKTTEVPKDE